MANMERCGHTDEGLTCRTCDSKPQHTPGPWTVDSAEQRDMSGARIFKVVTDHQNGADGLIADVSAWWVDRFSAEANARLIAAAPDMLSFIKNLIQTMRYQHNKRHLSGDIANLTHDARFLLARIDGEKS